MSQIINAVFENGVFKPDQKVNVREHEKVAIKIVPLDDWQERFNHIIERIHKKAVQYSAAEIEADIALAVKETREDKSGN